MKKNFSGLVILFLFVLSFNSNASQNLIEQSSSHSDSVKGNYIKGDTKKTWSVKKGQNLYGILSDWGMSNGWEVVWESKRNYVISASAEFKSMSIDDAIKNLLVSMGEVQPKVFVRIFDGNRVILVKSDSGI